MKHPKTNLIIAMALISSSASSQLVNQPFAIGSVSYGHYHDHFKIGNAPSLGVGLGNYFLAKHSFEVSAHWLDNKIYAHHSNHARARGLVFNGDYVFHKSPLGTIGSLEPVITAGLGYHHFNTSAQKNMMHLSFGVGAEYFFNRRFGVRAELKDTYVPSHKRHAFTPQIKLVYLLGRSDGLRMSSSQCMDVITYNQTNVLFDHDSSHVKPEYKQELKGVAHCLSKLPHKKVTIEGHASPVGSHTYNYGLSKKRALAVKKQLASMGVQGQRMAIKADGDGHPMSEFSEKSIDKERRVNIKEQR